MKTFVAEDGHRHNAAAGAFDLTAEACGGRALAVDRHDFVAGIKTGEEGGRAARHVAEGKTGGKLHAGERPDGIGVAVDGKLKAATGERRLDARHPEAAVAGFLRQRMNEFAEIDAGQFENDGGKFAVAKPRPDAAGNVVAHGAEPDGEEAFE